MLVAKTLMLRLQNESKTMDNVMPNPSFIYSIKYTAVKRLNLTT